MVTYTARSLIHTLHIVVECITVYHGLYMGTLLHSPVSLLPEVLTPCLLVLLPVVYGQYCLWIGDLEPVAGLYCYPVAVVASHFGV